MYIKMWSHHHLQWLCQCQENMGMPSAVAMLAPEMLQNIIRHNMDIGVSGVVKCVFGIGGGCAIAGGCVGAVGNSVSAIGGCVGAVGCVVLS